MTFTVKQTRDIVESLQTKTLYDTGIAFGLDKHYTTVSSMKAGIYQLYAKVKADPAKYKVTPETVDKVTEALSSRLPTTIPDKKYLREKREEQENVSFSELVLSGRVKAMKLLHAKIDRIGKSRKKLDDTNLSTLGTVAGILFDKGQIISGEATENVAVLAKVKSEMSPDEAIDTVLKMREAYQVDKDRTNKKK